MTVSGGVNRIGSTTVSACGKAVWGSEMQYPAGSSATPRTRAPAGRSRVLARQALAARAGSSDRRRAEAARANGAVDVRQDDGERHEPSAFAALPGRSAACGCATMLARPGMRASAAGDPVPITPSWATGPPAAGARCPGQCARVREHRSDLPSSGAGRSAEVRRGQDDLASCQQRSAAVMPRFSCT